MKIGVIGNGFVGKTMTNIDCEDIQVTAYDTNPLFCFPDENVKIEDLLGCEIIFISVPTPMNKDGSCYTKIITIVLNQLRELHYNGFIVLRSTVPVGTSDELNVYFMPEFLTEKNFLEDFKQNNNWFFGLLGTEKDMLFKMTINELFYLAVKNNKVLYNNIHFMSNKEAEMIKMFRNCYLSVKVSFCNEINEFCTLKQIDYDKVRTFACIDERIGLSHTSVPGHDGLYGFGGTCFPKDTSSLLYEMDKTGMQSYVLKSAVDRNNIKDRPEKDWALDKGRAVV
jgi:UDPglucose 6-dehydrogenase